MAAQLELSADEPVGRHGGADTYPLRRARIVRDLGHAQRTGRDRCAESASRQRDGDAATQPGWCAATARRPAAHHRALEADQPARLVDAATALPGAARPGTADR